MLIYSEFCEENELDKEMNTSYIHYGFYCQGYARALINIGV